MYPYRESPGTLTLTCRDDTRQGEGISIREPDRFNDEGVGRTTEGEGVGVILLGSYL